MFPSVKTRFASAARRSFDLALEFATLGEYRLSEAPPAPRAAPVSPRSSRTAGAGAPTEVRARPRTTRTRDAEPVSGPDRRDRDHSHA
jgi:hypothetical protein